MMDQVLTKSKKGNADQLSGDCFLDLNIPSNCQYQVESEYSTRDAGVILR